MTTSRIQGAARCMRGACRAWRGKALPLLLAACFTGNALANPTGAQVVNGQATITNQNGILSIVNTPGTVINWQSFSIDTGETTRFIQQSTSSAVLNRIVGQDPSRILGALQSNGKVFLINPNGVIFGEGARVNVNGLVASSLNISNEDFAAGKFNFKAGSTAGSVKNQGVISTPTGGQVFLIAPNVENSGIISSPKGDVVLAAGHSVQLVDSSNPDLHVVVSAPDNEALNLGQVIAQGGRIGIYGALVNQRGLVSANSAEIGENGKIVFKASKDTILGAGSVTTATGDGRGGDISILGDRVGVLDGATVDASGKTGGGTVLVGGDYHGGNVAVQNAKRTFVGSNAQIKADALASGNGGKVIVWADEAARVHGGISARGGAQGGNGGFIETSGHSLDVDGIRVDASAPRGKAGTWLLDPYDIAVVAAGGSTDLTQFDQFADLPANGISNINASAISAATADVMLQATHDITFSSAINITAANVDLTAKAGNNINVNSAITANSGRIALYAADSGAFSVAPNPGTGALTVGAALSASAVTLSAGGNIAINSIIFTPVPPPLCDCISGVSISTSNGAITGSGTVSGSYLSAYAKNGMNLHTAVQSLYAENTGASGDIHITNTGPLTISGIYQPVPPNLANSTGSIYVDNTGALTVSGGVHTDQGGISLVAHSPLTVNGTVISNGGSVSLTAGSSGVQGSGDTLKISTGATVSAGGSISLWAGDGVTIEAGSTVSPTPSISANNNLPPLPTLSDCIANPNLSGCSSVLPTLSQCIATPTLSGCSVVLPTLSQCIATPTLSGCSVVLPTLSQCITTPTLSGCSVVLPTLAQCTADPALSGCSAVLPTLSQCIAAPTMSGCSAVLPTSTQCAATPTLPGCSVVAPTLAQCIANPNLSGCSAVLPTLSQCIATPTLSGCSVILPTLTQCTAIPSLQGCSAVLPTLQQCVATPTLAGCNAVLPTVSLCSTTPSAPGCEVVLPPVTTANNVEVAQAINSTVNTINTTATQVVTLPTTPPSGAPSPASNPAPATKKSSSSNDSKTDKVATNNIGARKNDPTAPKMYCN